MYSFGSGVLFGTRTDVAGATPVNFGLVQEVTIEESVTVKELYGQFQHPLAVARGTIKTTGKAKTARISALAMGNLFYGVQPVPGQLATAFQEAGAIPSAAPYTVPVANQATFVADCGVTFVASGLPLRLVASAPAAGQYSLAGGVYTFAAADAGKAVLPSYTYTIPSTGLQIPVTNQLLGTTPTFSARFYTIFEGQAVSLTMAKCTSNKLAFGSKLEDWTIPEFDFMGYADASGAVLTWSFSEAS